MLDADNSKSSGKRGRYNSCNVSDQDLDDEESEKRRKFLERNRYNDNNMRILRTKL